MTQDFARLFSLDGKRVLVTGGGRGLGRGIASAMAAAGASVFLVGRTTASLQSAAEEIGERTGAEVAFEAANVAEEEDVLRLSGVLRERFGGLDVLVNNAGVNPIYRDIRDISLDDWRQILSVNLDGVFLCCKHLGGLIADGDGGAIINISSIAGHVGLRKASPYCASKGGVELLSKALALDWAARRVRVNCIAPGFFETDLTEGMRNHEAISARLLGQTPLGRFGGLDDIVGAALYLASPAGEYVTGQSLLVDGGWTAA